MSNPPKNWRKVPTMSTWRRGKWQLTRTISGAWHITGNHIPIGQLRHAEFDTVTEAVAFADTRDAELSQPA